jgi:transcriptional regulator with XRE-family HTH domain
MITAAQLRAARVLLGIDQRQLAELSGLSAPTIQRMEASESMVRGNVDSLVKLITALEGAGIELIDEGAVSARGRGAAEINSDRHDLSDHQIETKASRNEGAQMMPAVARQMVCVAGLSAGGSGDRTEPHKIATAALHRHSDRLPRRLGRCAGCSAARPMPPA